MPIPLGSTGQPDFTQPIELMMDCHRRIEHFLAVLGRVADRYAQAPLDAQGRQALETSLNYFEHAAPRHTADEEESLFPRMRQRPDAATREAMARIDRLEHDHRDAEVAHDRLDQIGRRWLTDGTLSPSDVAAFREVLSALVSTYAEHIRMEDELVFATARDVLDAQALAEIGQEMHQRRQENPGRPGSRCAERRGQGPTPGATGAPGAAGPSGGSRAAGGE